MELLEPGFKKDCIEIGGITTIPFAFTQRPTNNRSIVQMRARASHAFRQAPPHSSSHSLSDRHRHHPPEKRAFRFFPTLLLFTSLKTEVAAGGAAAASRATPDCPLPACLSTQQPAWSVEPHYNNKCFVEKHHRFRGKVR